MEPLKAQRICDVLLDDNHVLSDTETTAMLSDPEALKDVSDALQVHVLLQMLDQPPVPPAHEANADPASRALAVRVMSVIQRRRRTRTRHRQYWSAAAVLVISLGTLALCQTSHQRRAPDAPPSGLAKATSSQAWTCDGTTVAAGSYHTIDVDDSIAVGVGILSVQCDDGTQLTLSSHTRLRSASALDQPWHLDDGHLHAVVTPHSTMHPMTFAVREGTIHITGTTLDIIADALGSTIRVSEGSVSVLAQGSAHTVTSGQALTLGAVHQRTAPPTGTGVELPWLGHATPMPVFNDRLLQSSGWLSLRTQQPWASDQRGWPLNPIPDGGVATVMLTHMGAGYLSGTWTLTWAGTGFLSVNSWPDQAIELQREAHRLHLGIIAGNGIQLEVQSSDPANPVRDIRFLADENRLSDELLPSFRADWTGSALVRTGAWSPPAKLGAQLRWEDRILAGDGPGSMPERRVVAPELCIKAAEQLNAPLWWVVPIHADDNYIHELARLAASRVHAEQPTLVSYSNADLPSADDERIWLQQAGQAAGHDAAVAAPRYAAERSLAVFAHWRAVFAAAQLPLVCLVPGGDQTWNQHVSSWRRCGFHADALTVPDVQYVDCNLVAGESAHDLTARLTQMTFAALRDGAPRKAHLDSDLPPIVWLDAGVVVRTPFPMTEVTRAAVAAWWTDQAIQDTVAHRRQPVPHETRILVDWADQYTQRIMAGVTTPARPVRRDDILWLKRVP